MKVKCTTTRHYQLDGFECQRCGKCCTELENVMVTPGVLALMADELWMSVARFKAEYKVVAEGDKYLLPQPCPMYLDGCMIYENRGQACQDFPLMKVTEKDNGEPDIAVHDICPAVDWNEKEGE